MTALRQIAPNDPRAALIVAAVNQLDQDEFERRHWWDNLRDISSRTVLEAVDIDPGSIVLDSDDRFEAAADLLVMLHYGPSKDEESVGDSYPAIVRGHFDSGEVHLDEVVAEVSSFYE